MGQNATTASSGNACVDNQQPQQSIEPTDKDVNFLLGKLENLPQSAHRLFSLGKQFLTTGLKEDEESSGGNQFSDLFEVFKPRSTEDPENPDCLQNVALNQNPPSLFTMPMRKSAALHHFQTFVQWKAAQDLTNFYSLCLPKRHTVYLCQIGHFPDFIHNFRLHKSSHLELNIFEVVQAFLQVFCGLEVLLMPSILLDNAEDDEGQQKMSGVQSRIHPVTKSKQLCLNDLYPRLQGQLPTDALCIMGFSWTDLYPVGHNFVLGEASPQHRAAVISFGRFETQAYDASTHKDVTEINAHVVWKLIKSSSHELCHLLGLQHCTFFRCAMNESSSVSEAMDQPLFLCPVCLRKLQQACKFDVLERYHLLHKFLSWLAEQLPGDEVRLSNSLLWLSRCITYLES